MWSFRGSCANRRNGMEQASSDVATGVGLEPTGGIAAAQTLSGRHRYDRSGTPPYSCKTAIKKIFWRYQRRDLNPRKNQTEAQRSGFGLERRSDGASEI